MKLYFFNVSPTKVKIVKVSGEGKWRKGELVGYVVRETPKNKE